MPFNHVDLLLMIKKAASDVIAAQKPVEILYGIVETDSPLSIRINQNTLLLDVDLVLCRNLTNYAIDLTESELGTRTYQVNNALKIGEKVVLFRFQGGQDYLVYDRVV